MMRMKIRIRPSSAITRLLSTGVGLMTLDFWSVIRCGLSFAHPQSLMQLNTVSLGAAICRHFLQQGGCQPSGWISAIMLLYSSFCGAENSRSKNSWVSAMTDLSVWLETTFVTLVSESIGVWTVVPLVTLFTGVATAATTVATSLVAFAAAGAGLTQPQLESQVVFKPIAWHWLMQNLLHSHAYSP